MTEELTVTNQKLLDLYKIPIKTTSNETVDIFVNQEVERKQKEFINNYKKLCE